ncbi:MAG: TerB family tellurite resistance protein [Pseudomonadota bacterium]
MHIILGILTLLGTAIFLWYRLRDARQMGGEVLDAADDLRGKVRRIMYKRKNNVHPADAVDDPRLAASGISVAVATMDAPISQAEITALTKAATRTFEVTEREALDIVSFGRWISDQCGTNEEAVRRLSKVVAKLAGPEAGPDMVAMITEVATAGGAELGEQEQDAIDTVRRALGFH